MGEFEGVCCGGWVGLLSAVHEHRILFTITLNPILMLPAPHLTLEIQYIHIHVHHDSYYPTSR